jgi:adenylate cyclase class 2
VWKTAERLALNQDELTSENTTAVYARYGVDLESIRELRFTT